jgi:hypothetical protein
MEYATARGADPGPISTDFAATCDQIDHADAMLTELRYRVRDGRGLPEPAWPDTDGQRLIAMARRDPGGRTVSLILNATTANIALHAITARSSDREATSAKSNTTASSSPKTPTAAAIARPSPPAKPESPPACEPSNTPTGQRSTRRHTWVDPIQPPRSLTGQSTTN